MAGDVYKGRNIEREAITLDWQGIDPNMKSEPHGA